jgi:hypothetical protein
MRSIMSATTSARTPTRHLDVDGVRFSYRESMGDAAGVPLVLLHHFTATMDDWDPRVLDGIATEKVEPRRSPESGAPGAQITRKVSPRQATS